jgi:endonuclease I
VILTHKNHIRMRILLSFLALCFVYSSFAQVPAYYNNVNLNTTGQSLKANLASKITSSQNQTISYTPGVWNALQQTDLSSSNSSRVVLIYGYSDSDGNSTTDLTRSKYNTGGNSTDWNREHVYPKSLGTPSFSNSGPGSDPHHVRASDVNRNASRSNRKFASGSGNSAITAQGNWYPGDEFKGDVARMILYMYLRYGTRCLPRNVAVGTLVSNDQNMVELFLQWNAEDPVSSLETQRNNVLQNLIGNRNPFIDNPAFATQIWGGQQAEDLFGTGTGGGTNPPTTTTTPVTLRLIFDNYPAETSWEITNSSNQIVHSGNNYGSQAAGSTISISKTLEDGCYNLIMKDSYGDGMCCSYGNGSFLFTNNNTNNTITSGGSFQSVDSKSFCINTSARLVQNNNNNNTSTTLEAFTETKAALELSIYPNPAKEFLYVESTTKQALNYTIRNAVGQTLVNGTIQNQQIAIQKLPKGIYILSINNGVDTYTKKFIKA